MELGLEIVKSSLNGFFKWKLRRSIFRVELTGQKKEVTRSLLRN